MKKNKTRSIIIGLFFMWGVHFVWGMEFNHYKRFKKVYSKNVTKSRNAVSITNGDYLAVTSKDDEVDVYKIYLDFLERVCKYKHANISKLTLSCSGYVASLSHNGTLVVWNIKDNKKVFTYRAFGSMRRVVFSPDGNYIALGGKLGEVVVLDVVNQKELYNDLFGDSIRFLLFSKDMKYALASSWSGFIKIYDLTSKKTLYSCNHDAELEDLKVSHDNRYVAFADLEGCVKVYDVKKNCYVFDYKSEQHWATDLCFSRDSRFFAFGTSMGVVFICEIDKIAKKAVIVDKKNANRPFNKKGECKHGFVTALRLRGDGRYVAVGYYNGDLVFYDLLKNSSFVYHFKKNIYNIYFVDTRYMYITFKNGPSLFFDLVNKEISHVFDAEDECAGIYLTKDAGHIMIILKNGDFKVLRTSSDMFLARRKSLQRKQKDYTFKNMLKSTFLKKDITGSPMPTRKFADVIIKHTLPLSPRLWRASRQAPDFAKASNFAKASSDRSSGRQGDPTSLSRASKDTAGILGKRNRSGRLAPQKRRKLE